MAGGMGGKRRDMLVMDKIILCEWMYSPVVSMMVTVLVED